MEFTFFNNDPPILLVQKFLLHIFLVMYVPLIATRVEFQPHKTYGNKISQILEADHPIHRHCFTGSWEEAKTWLDMFPNSYIGLTPLVTHKYSHRSLGPRDVARKIPLNRLLLETDAPYFVPKQVSVAKLVSSEEMGVKVVECNLIYVEVGEWVN